MVMVFRDLEWPIVSVISVTAENTNKSNRIENGAIMNCSKSLTMIDCDSFQHLKKHHYWGFASSNEKGSS